MNLAYIPNHKLGDDQIDRALGNLVAAATLMAEVANQSKGITQLRAKSSVELMCKTFETFKPYGTPEGMKILLEKFKQIDLV